MEAIGAQEAISAERLRRLVDPGRAYKLAVRFAFTHKGAAVLAEADQEEFRRKPEGS